MLDNTIFAQNMNALGVIYEKTLTKELLKIYYAILQVMENEDFKQAIRGLLSERVYPTFPKPAEILERTNVKEVIQLTDEHEVKAKELIDLVYDMNNEIYQTHIKSGKSFDTLLEAVKFPSVSDEDIAILNNVRPHFSLKLLISNISAYQTSLEQLQAFKMAIKQGGQEAMSFEVRKRLGNMK